MKQDVVAVPTTIADLMAAVSKITVPPRSVLPSLDLTKENMVLGALLAISKKDVEVHRREVEEHNKRIDRMSAFEREVGGFKHENLDPERGFVETGRVFKALKQILGEAAPTEREVRELLSTLERRKIVVQQWSRGDSCTDGKPLGLFRVVPSKEKQVLDIVQKSRGE